MDFDEKVVLITGASSGIGAATAERFAKLGASLALTGQNGSNLEKVASKCRIFNGVDPFLFIADLTNEADVKNLVKSVLGHFKRLDILVNNAGIVERGSVENNASLAHFDKILNTNLRSVYHLTILLVPYLIATKGTIINVSSIAGFRPFPNGLAYCMSKAALDHFTRCTALELAPKGVRVNGVNPGVIKTNIITRNGKDIETYEKRLESSIPSTPLGRHGLAEDVAKSITFLASNDASFTIGATLPIDGGYPYCGSTMTD